MWSAAVPGGEGVTQARANALGHPCSLARGSPRRRAWQSPVLWASAGPRPAAGERRREERRSVRQDPSLRSGRRLEAKGCARQPAQAGLAGLAPGLGLRRTPAAACGGRPRRDSPARTGEPVSKGRLCPEMTAAFCATIALDTVLWTRNAAETSFETGSGVRALQVRGAHRQARSFALGSGCGTIPPTGSAAVRRPPDSPRMEGWPCRDERLLYGGRCLP